MNRKFFSILQDKCKDFGLSEKAIEDLAKAVGEGVTDETSDEDIQKLADSLVPYAKLMQAEVTRKAQKVVEPQPKPQDTKPKGGGNGNNKDDDDVPEWFTKYKSETEASFAALRKENDELKAERTKTERASQIASMAKSLGIPDFLMKRVSIADGADIEKELTDYKQELVTNRLMPAEQANLRSSSDEAAKDEAKAWANALP